MTLVDPWQGYPLDESFIHPPRPQSGTESRPSADTNLEMRGKYLI